MAADKWLRLKKASSDIESRYADVTERDRCGPSRSMFGDLHKGGATGVVSALLDEPGAVTNSLSQNPETDAILSAAQTILDFKTKAARDIEGGRIKMFSDALADAIIRQFPNRFV